MSTQAADAAKPIAKRKLQDGAAPSKKRRKSGGSDDTIRQLETEIAESKKHYNNIAVLVELAQKHEDDDSIAISAAEALCRVFIRLLTEGKLVKRAELSEKERTVVEWLRERLWDYRKALDGMLSNSETAYSALMLSMALLKTEAHHLSDKDGPVFPHSQVESTVGALLQSPVDQLRNEYAERFVLKYHDIRFHTIEAIKSFLQSEKADETARDNAFEILIHLDSPPTADDLEDSFYVGAPTSKKHPLRSIAQHKNKTQAAWLAVMHKGLNKEQRKRALEAMATTIAPWFSKPEMLMDFLTDSYNAGGTTSLLALSGVFYLIQKRNLDYPLFYTKLYSLLDADLLHSKYRSRFFRLLDTFLGSSHLPAVLVASFIKRLARLALSAPPSAIVAIVPWFYNIFKKHPLTTFMMHRVPRTQEQKELYESEGLQDPFLPDEADPMETKAIDSCLWEIVQLQSHYHPNVATIAKIISEQFTKQAYNIEDFLDHSYGSLLEAEMHKEVKKPPVVEYMIPKKIFGPDVQEPEKDSLLVKLWDFGSA